MPQSPEEIALQRIRQAADSRAKTLDLSNLGLTSLPPEIGYHTNQENIVTTRKRFHATNA